MHFADDGPTSAPTACAHWWKGVVRRVWRSLWTIAGCICSTPSHWWEKKYSQEASNILYHHRILFLRTATAWYFHLAAITTTLCWQWIDQTPNTLRRRTENDLHSRKCKRCVSFRSNLRSSRDYHAVIAPNELKEAVIDRQAWKSLTHKVSQSCTWMNSS